MKKTAALILVFIIIFQAFSPLSFAATESNKYIDSYSASISKASNSTIQVSFNVYGTHYMDSIGSSIIYLYKDGSLFTVFLQSDPQYSANMFTTNALYFYGQVSYSNAPAGTYYAVVCFFASDGTGTGSGTRSTGTITIP